MFYGNSLLVFEQPLLMNQYSDSDRLPASARTAKRSKDDLWNNNNRIANEILIFFKSCSKYWCRFCLMLSSVLYPKVGFSTVELGHEVQFRGLCAERSQLENLHWLCFRS